MEISDKGLAFVRLHEGLVTRAYRDSVGVWTIGEGFTDRSAIFSAYWRQTRGHGIQPGDTITKAECDTLVGRMMVGEYAVNIDAKAKPSNQAQYDACCSISWNCGPGSLNDGWARELAAGDVTMAAAAVRVYKLTGGILRGRRADEARLMETGDYGQIDMAVHGTADAPSVSQSVAEVSTYQQQLAALGIYKGAIDGIAASSRAAVILFQGRHPELVADGIVGPATRATILRDLAVKPAVAKPTAPPAHLPPATPANATAAAGGAIVVAAGGIAAASGRAWVWIVAAGIAVVAVVAFVIIKAKKG